ncbi:MAG: multidrug ABC transporter ATP-binding protein [Lentisphaerae bacterium RIFOXYA12_FULL_48_11]|nr:MAG: multidrug ABC transporter ATP-binding protein [Lentisphaerae bacterium RIFOXYA12_FULL_48_11]
MDMEKQAGAVIEVNNLTKVFKDFWRRPKVRAVDGLNLDIKKGEIFGLLGPNGSGKSTTIKILLGLLHATSGSVTVLGRSPRDVATKARIGYLPEESYLYNYLTPYETLNFYGSLFGLDGRVRRERIDQLLEMTGLKHAAGRSVGEFSKGMARRVGLAQALINDPELVILDEPTSGLDPVGCRQVKDLMITLAKRGKTIILSSHLLADVEDVCDRIAILYNGSIRAQGGVNQLLEKQESVRLTMPSLPPEVMRKVLELIRKEVGKEPQVDHPSMNLEQFFLEVVEKANRMASQQSGAAPTEMMADYLKK